MRINTPSNQINYTPQYRRPAQLRAPGPPIPREQDNTLGNIGTILGASSQLLGQVMSIADSYANYRAQKALNPMVEDAGRVFDDMEAYNGDDFHEELQRRLDEVFTTHAQDYSGMTRNVIEATWSKWKGQRVDQFETAINGRNREMELSAILAQIEDPATTREERAELGQALVDKNYRSEIEAQQYVARIEHSFFLDEQIQRYASSEDPGEVLSILEQDENGDWIVQFEGRDLNMEDRQAIVDGASKILMLREREEQRKLEEKSDGFHVSWRAEWERSPGSIAAHRVVTARENGQITQQHFDWWMSRIENWNAEQTRERSGAQEAAEQFAYNNLYSLGLKMLNENVNSLQVETAVYARGTALGLSDLQTEQVIADLRRSYENLDAESMIEDALDGVEDILSPRELGTLRTELRDVLRDDGQEAMYDRVNAVASTANLSQIRTLLEGRKEQQARKLRQNVFSQWDGWGVIFQKGDVEIADDIQQLHPVEALISTSSSGLLPYLEENYPERAQETKNLIKQLKPHLDDYFRDRIDSSAEDGTYNDQTGQITYFSGGQAYRPVIRNNVATFERIDTSQVENSLDAFLDDRRLELGMFPYLLVGEDSNGVSRFYGLPSSSARGTEDLIPLRPLSSEEIDRFRALGGQPMAPYASRRYDYLLDLKWE